MSTTTTSISASSTACSGNLWQIPTTDPACAGVVSGNITEAMHKCCQKASPKKYENDCGIYCLAVDHNIERLLSCIQTVSGKYNSDVFCNAPLNATATATATATSSKPTTSTATGTGATSTETNAAIANQPVSKSGLGLVALVFGSAFMAVLA